MGVLPVKILQFAIRTIGSCLNAPLKFWVIRWRGLILLFLILANRGGNKVRIYRSEFFAVY